MCYQQANAAFKSKSPETNGFRTFLVDDTKLELAACLADSWPASLLIHPLKRAQRAFGTGHKLEYICA